MADNYTVKDGGGSLITIRASELPDGSYAPHAQPQIPTSFYAGRVVVNQVAQQLSSIEIKDSITLENRSEGTANIYIGVDNAVTTETGYQLGPGKKTPPLKIDNADKIWVIAHADAVSDFGPKIILQYMAS